MRPSSGWAVSPDLRADYLVRVSVDDDVWVMGSEKKLTAILGFSDKTDDLHDDAVVEIVLWLVNDQGAGGLAQ
jgi:hypothetical protein